MDADLISKISIFAIPVLMAIAMHEAARAWAARYFGDNSPEIQRRITLNPVPHIDPIGTILLPLMLVLGGFWLGQTRHGQRPRLQKSTPRLALGGGGRGDGQFNHDGVVGDSVKNGFGFGRVRLFFNRSRQSRRDGEFGAGGV
jgi:hypothetical protein